MLLCWCLSFEGCVGFFSKGSEAISIVVDYEPSLKLECSKDAPALHMSAWKMLSDNGIAVLVSMSRGSEATRYRRSLKFNPIPCQGDRRRSDTVVVRYRPTLVRDRKVVNYSCEGQSQGKP